MKSWVRHLGLAVAILLAAQLSAASALPMDVELTYLGMVTIETGATVGGTVIRDLSGIAYDRATDGFAAVSDTGGIGAARIYEFDLDYDASGVHGVTAISAASLRTESNDLLPSVDAEGLALTQGGRLYVSTEGRNVSSPADSRDPRIWEFDVSTLNRTATLPVPDKFLPLDANGNPVPPSHANQVSGVRLNLGFECLGLTPAERSLYAANEAALLQDDARAPFDGQFNQAHHSDSRIVRYRRDANGDWQPGPERIYRADRGTLFIFVRRFNTIPSLLPVADDGRLLVMERGLTQNNLNTGSYRIRIYEVNADDESVLDVAPYDSLLDLPSPLVLTRLSKRLVWQNSSGMDNVEGMTWGRDINGFRSLVLVSDNNSSANQITQFHVLLSNIPAPVALTVTAEGPGVVRVDPPLADHLPGSTVDLGADADPGKVFIRWSGDASGQDETTSLTIGTGTPLYVGARFGSPFERWLAGHFSDEAIDEQNLLDRSVSSADDGIPNLMRYALGLGPWDDAAHLLPRAARVSDELRYLYRLDGNRPDIAWRIVGTTDLMAGWADAAVLFDSTFDPPPSPDNGWFSLALPDSLDGVAPPDRAQFLRLELIPLD